MFQIAIDVSPETPLKKDDKFWKDLIPPVEDICYRA